MSAPKTIQLFYQQPEGLPRHPQRFSLLLLDEGEVYIDDQSAVYYPPNDANPQRLDATFRQLFATPKTCFTTQAATSTLRPCESQTVHCQEGIPCARTR